MKHIFIINSHTTFLTSMGTVSYLGLRDEDVVFMYMRNYRNIITHVPFQTIQITEIVNSCQNMMDGYINKIKNVDLFVEQSVGKKFHLYVPHLCHYFFQILYTNKLCKRVSYVQEGGPAQRNVYITDVPIIEQIKTCIRLAILGRRTFEGKWYIKGSIYKQLRLDSYATNNEYFRWLPSKNHIVKWPQQQLNIKLDHESPIFIFDGFITSGSVEPDKYLRCCKEIICKYSKKNNYVKFHPAQKENERNIILTYFTEYKRNAEIMCDDIPTEYVIMQFKNLTFVGFMSSLLYYAHDFGHKVICCEDLIINSSPAYQKHLVTTGFITFGETYKKKKTLCLPQK